MKRYVILAGAVALLVALLQGPLSLARGEAPGAATAVPAMMMARATTTLVHHTAVVNGVRLHYVTAGRGDPLVLLHGFTETWYEWRRVMPTLAQHYTVIAPDLPGLGDSARPACCYDTRSVAADIYALVRRLGYRRILLVGHDWGGPVGYAYAAAHRADVRAFAFIDAFVPGRLPPAYLQLSRATQGNAALFLLVYNAFPGLSEQLVAGRERAYLTTFYRRGSYNPASITSADVNEYVRTYAAPGAMHAGFGYYRAFFDDADQDNAYGRTKLTMPVLAIGGAQSFGDASRQMMHTVAANVRGVVLPRCGHYVPEEQPAALARLLLGFFAPVA